MRTEFWTRLGIDLRQHDLKQYDPKTLDQLAGELKQMARQRYAEREAVWSAERMRFHERMIMLQIVDAQWKDHLLTMDHLKEGIGLRGYGQRDPLVEYKRESYDMFTSLMDRIEDETLRYPLPDENPGRTGGNDPSVPAAQTARAGRDADGGRRRRGEAPAGHPP